MTSEAPSLLTWAADPVGPRPLPDPERRLVRGGTVNGRREGWPARLLARPELVADMAARGVAYARKTARTRGGLTINGEPAMTREVALVAVAVMREASELLRQVEHLDELLGDDARALDFTADDIEASSRAESNFLGGVRPLLPAPVADEVDAFLASHDNRGDLAQPELWTAYRAADAPGALGRNRFYERAAERWPAVKSNGARVFRTSATREPETGLDAELAELVDRYGREAILAALGAAS